MKITLIGRALLLGLLLVLVAGTSVASAPTPETLTSKQVLDTVREARGKVVVLNFFASWCQPCRMEIPHILELRERYGDTDLVILGLSVDQDSGAYLRFVEEVGFTYPVYRAGSDVSQLFQVGSIPKTLIWGKDGNLVVNHVGYMDSTQMKRIVNKLVSGS